LEYLSLEQYLGDSFADLVPLPSYVHALMHASSENKRHQKQLEQEDEEQQQQQQQEKREGREENEEQEDSLRVLEHLVTNLWIGTRPTTSPLHYDDYENLLCQISGEKELVLFAPEDIGYLYYEGRCEFACITKINPNRLKQQTNTHAHTHTHIGPKER